MAHARNFREVTVGSCRVQTAEDRFGPEALDIILARDLFPDDEEEEGEEEDYDPHNDSEDDDSDNNGVLAQPAATTNDTENVPLEERIPKMPQFRNNLTVLSQKYNLYLAAHRDRLYVYRPGAIPSQTLPRNPDLILRSKPTKHDRIVGGYQSPLGHQANAMRTGFLGSREVVALAFDDGSVQAYYIGDMARYIMNKSEEKPCQAPAPFFRDNVGRSAWGIAIHQKSRLLAFSSNRLEVIVYAFSLSQPPSAPFLKGLNGHYGALSVWQRKRNWMIILPLGPEGNNIPNIDFWSNADGVAEKICAVDIAGTLWVMEIWRAHHLPVKIPNVHAAPEDYNITGWGVAVIPFTSFLASPEAEGLGLGPRSSRFVAPRPPLDHKYYGVNQVLDITTSVKEVYDNPHVKPPRPATLSSSPDESDEEQSPSGEDSDIDSDVDLNIDPAVGPTEVELDEAQALVDLVLGDSIDDSDGEEVAVDEELDPSMLSDYFASAAATAQTPSESSEEADEAQSIDETVSSSEDDDVESEFYHLDVIDEQSKRQAAPLLCKGVYHRLSNDPVLPEEREGLGDQIYVPAWGGTYMLEDGPWPKRRFLLRPDVAINAKDVPASDPDLCREILENLAKRACLLRTYAKDVELVDLLYRQHGILCQDPIGNPPMQPHVRARTVRRLNTVLHVPELSLVVVTGGLGRVALLTLTRTASPAEDFSRGFSGADRQTEHGFRVDWILPRASEEVKRPRWALYGASIGPVPETDPERDGLLLRPAGSRKVSTFTSGSRKYRLVLHYRDHTILTYEISRDWEGKLDLI